MGLKLGLSHYRKSMGCVFSNRKMRKIHQNKREGTVFSRP
jgi:hypothetical protein